ncbi:MAG: (d)CMP kinase [Deltaproteobacteria bacterium]|nr:(d)CMP kinase [Deltaproteobacteria bacterium]
MKKGLLITIDGPAGAGKSTVSRLLANKLSYTYLDTGALYRALAYRCIQEGLSATDEGGIANLCQRTGIVLQNEEGSLRVLADGEDVTDKIRTESISLQASAIISKREERFDDERQTGSRAGNRPAQGTRRCLYCRFHTCLGRRGCRNDSVRYKKTTSFPVIFLNLLDILSSLC